MAQQFQEIGTILDTTYEYAFSSVPPEKRRSAAQLVPILMVFAFSSSGLTVGSTLGVALPFWKAFLACFLGNAALFVIALFWGLLGQKTGCASTMLVQKVLGRVPASIYSVLVISSAILWVGINGDLLATIILSLFPQLMMPLPVLVVLVLLAGTLLSITGWRGMAWLCRICAPLILLLTVCNLAQIAQFKADLQLLEKYTSMLFMPLSSAIVLVAGNDIVGATAVSNICRFAKDRRAAILSVSAYSASMLATNLCGILIVQATGAHSLNYGVYLLGIGSSNILWMVLCSYTTQHIYTYHGSLAFQHIVRETPIGGNISHRNAVFFMGGAAAIVGVLRVSSYILPIIGFALLTAAPLTAVMLAELWLGKKQPPVRPRLPLIAWCLGMTSSLLFSFLIADSLVVPVLISGVSYVLLRRRDLLKKS